MKQTIISIILLFCLLVHVTAKEISFRQISSDEGLISNNIVTIFQDSEDFIWFGTNYGLSRYDGYGFIHFQYSFSDSLSISNAFISTLMEDEEQNIWVGTANGLNLFNRNAFQIRPVAGFEGIHINTISQLDKDHILIGTNVSGLILYNIKTKVITTFLHSSDPSSISTNLVNRIVIDPSKGILVGTRNGLDIFDPINKTFSHFLHETDVTRISYYTDNSIFIGINEPGSYYVWNTSATHPEKKLLPEKYATMKVVFMEDDADKIWMGLEGKGLLIVDKHTNATHHLVYNKYNQEGLNSNVVTCSFIDKWQNIWFGTFDAGVNFWEKQGKNFKYVRDNFLPNGLRNNRVRSAYQDSENDIWIGTKVNGTLSKFNRETLTFQHYLTGDSPEESNNYILSITEHKPGWLWLGTFNGLYLFNKRKGSYKIINTLKDGTSIRSKRIYALLQDSNLLYIGHQALGLDVYDIEKQTATNYSSNNNPSGILSNKVRVLYKDKRGDIWVGTAGGLNKFDQKNGTFESFVHSEGDTTSISDNSVLSIYEDKANNFWVGTHFGLNLLNRETKTFKTFSEKDGFPIQAINGIYDDNKGNIWLSTHHGILKYNPLNKKISRYSTSDGISANELTAPHLKSNTGEIYFGSNRGFTMFHPDEILDNQTVPNVVLTSFKIANKEVPINKEASPLKQHISRCKDITLNYKQTVISLEYVAINYSGTEKNKYAYKMDGLDDDWNYVGEKREVSYTNFSPGEYTFRVKASNGDGVWNEEGVSLNIHVLPPPWLSWWAYIIYFFIVVAIVLVYRNYLINRLKDKNELKQNEEKLHFFLNVSHEFRTPITLLLLPLQRILKSNDISEAKLAAKEANTSALKLMNLANQLLEYRKTEVGHLPLKAQEVDIIDYSEKLFKPFTSLGENLGVQMFFKTDQSKVNAWVDPDKYEKIINNLLSNAIKFTPHGGSITLSITAQLEQNGLEKKSGALIINVTDTGTGIAEDRIEHIFERFYSKEKVFNGTGIGLHYTKSLVELHGGSISVKSKPEEGSVFTFTLPLGDQHLLSDQKSSTPFGFKDYSFDDTALEALNYDLKSKKINQEPSSSTVEKESDNASTNLPLVLIVEDNKLLRSQLKQEMSKQFSVVEAENGQDGWNMIQKHTPDLVISDIMMPIMDGIQLCNNLKGDDELCHIPIVLLTARGSVEHQLEGFEIGADDYISKPFHMEILVSRVKNILDARIRLRERLLSSSNAITTKALATNNQEKKFLDSLSNLVLENIANVEFGLPEIQQKLGISRTSLYLKVNELTGTSPSVYVRTLKLKYAAELLTQNRYSIKEICYLSGFKNASYFNQLFKEAYKLTPLQYRTQKENKG